MAGQMVNGYLPPPRADGDNEARLDPVVGRFDQSVAYMKGGYATNAWKTAEYIGRWVLFVIYAVTAVVLLALSVK